MTSFSVSVLINTPPDIVNRAMQNPENHTFWMTGLEKFEPIKGGPEEVGSVARLFYLQKGQSYIMEDKLIACEPGKKYVSEVSGDTIVARVEINLYPSGDSTEISLRWSGKAKNLMLKLMLPLLRKKLIRQTKDELAVFKGLVESKGVNFNIE
ncbi:SRPBCC family protein [Bacteroidota bacterium]